MAELARLLTDEQMQQFITNGCLILKTDFSQEFHRELLEQLNHVYEEEGNPGNNLLPRIPQLQQVFEHPVIHGALTSVLGSGYMLHAHRHGHFNNVPKPGGWHKDSYWGYYRTRNHHPWWAMIMYFPQDTPVELGPTGIMPGTQFYESRTFASDENPEEVLAAGGAGTFALIHYDIWHRSTANLLGQPRYMLKFEFMRTQAPSAPSWNNQDPVWHAPAELGAAMPRLDALWEETWNWLSGRIGAASEASAAGTAGAADIAAWIAQLQDESPDVRAEAANRLGMSGPASTEVVAALSGALEDAFEPVALNAAYGLARLGEAGANALLQALRHERVAVSRNAAYGLTAVGAGALTGLVEALGSERAETVVHAVFALGELRELAASTAARLAVLLEHPAETVRRAVIEALGIIGSPAEVVVPALTRGLQDSDAQVRFMTGLSLSRLGKQAETAVPKLVEALEDENRYVRAHAAEALMAIGTEKAKDALLRFLMLSRWCPTTTPKSTFYP